MGDAADKVTADDERAMALLEEQQHQRRIADSFNAYDPGKPVYCFDCGEPVEVRRLNALPHTRRCVGCATLIEQSYRRPVAT